MPAEKIAFVGVGRMGANMARRLKECHYTVSAVYDVPAPSAAALATEIGATHATSLAAVTAAADVIITVVTDDASQLAIFGESGDSLLLGAKGKTFINCATLTPKIHVEIERRARTVGAVSHCLRHTQRVAIAGMKNNGDSCHTPAPDSKKLAATGLSQSAEPSTVLRLPSTLKTPAPWAASTSSPPTMAMFLKNISCCAMT